MRRRLTTLLVAITASGAAWLMLTPTPAVSKNDHGSAVAMMKAAGAKTVHSVAEGKRRAFRAGLDGPVITVVSHELNWQYVDDGPAGDSMGDYMWSTGTLYTANHTKGVGSQFLRCEFTDIGGWCEQPIRIAGKGKILLSNPNLDGDDTVAVVGGTGVYKSVGGQAKLFVLDNGHVFDIMFVIELER